VRLISSSIFPTEHNVRQSIFSCPQCWGPKILLKAWFLPSKRHQTQCGPFLHKGHPYNLFVPTKCFRTLRNPCVSSCCGGCSSQSLYLNFQIVEYLKIDTTCGKQSQVCYSCFVYSVNLSETSCRLSLLSVGGHPTWRQQRATHYDSMYEWLVGRATHYHTLMTKMTLGLYVRVVGQGGNKWSIGHLSVCQWNVEEINAQCNRHVSPGVHSWSNNRYTDWKLERL
jgi:hypothetical protein